MLHILQQPHKKSQIRSILCIIIFNSNIRWNQMNKFSTWVESSCEYSNLFFFFKCFCSTASSRLDHSCSPPLPGSGAAVGLLHGAHCSKHQPLIPPRPWRFVSGFTQWRTSSLPGRGATSVHGRACFSAYCSAPRIPLEGTAPLRVGSVRGPNAWRSMREQLSVMRGGIYTRNPPFLSV